MSRSDESATRLALLSVLAVAAGLRFTALGYGAGIDARPDEPGVLMTLDMLGPSGSPSPMLGLYGATFFLPLYAVVRLVGLWHGWSAPLSTAQLVPALVVARAWSATLSTLAVWLTYRLGRRVGDRAVGLLAAAMLAVSPLVVREAHSAKPDSAAMVVTAAWLLLAVRPWRSSKWRAFALGAAAAFVADTKLLLGIGLPMLVAVLWPGTDGDRPRWRDAILRARASALDPASCVFGPPIGTHRAREAALGLPSPRATLVYGALVDASDQAEKRARRAVA